MQADARKLLSGRRSASFAASTPRPTAGSIAELARVVGFRNVLIHAYSNVDSRIVWGIIDADLNPLRKSLGALLAKP